MQSLFVQVTRSALTNACGIAGIMLTTQAVMVEKKTAKGGSGVGAPGLRAGMPGGMPSGMTV